MLKFIEKQKGQQAAKVILRKNRVRMHYDSRFQDTLQNSYYQNSLVLAPKQIHIPNEQIGNPRN